jgi:hypothetical protein
MSSNLLFSKLVVRFPFLAMITLAIMLTACGGTPPEATREVLISDVQVNIAGPTVEPYIFKTSEPGTITVHGVLVVLDPMTIIPAPGDSIYLVSLPIDQPISGIPSFEIGAVPQADVDERTGDFVFTNIQPGQYAVVVITHGGAQIPVRYMETATYAIFTVEASQADTTVDLGSMTLP